MESNLLEIVIFSEGKSKKKMIAEWLTKSALPSIVKQEGDAKKLILKTLTNAPAIYMS